MSELTTAFLEFTRMKFLQQYWPRLKNTVESLSDEQVWWRPNEASNSVGNLLLHLNGNIRQWMVAPFEQVPDTRERPREFSSQELIPGAVLLQELEATIEQAARVLDRLTADDLLQPMEIQGYSTSGLKAVYQVVEHFAMHYGQIVYVTKQLCGEDLGFYRELDSTGRIERK